MLQQTQVARVIPKYEAWLKQFPTINSLAKASKRDVLQLWSGLGYNRRALYLREAAKIIVEKFNGAFPREINTVKTLPGVGEYTACAIACFAFNQQIAVVDTNVRKVISLEFFKGKVPDKKTLQEVSAALLPKEDPARHASRPARQCQSWQGRACEGVAGGWNQALMDYSAVVLKDKKILTSKQTRFIGSDRYYRGQIMKLLVQKKVVEIDQVEELFSSEHKDRFRVILRRMKKDGLIHIQDNTIMLPS